METKLPIYELEVPSLPRPCRAPAPTPAPGGVLVIDNGSYELRAGQVEFHKSVEFCFPFSFASSPQPDLKFPNHLIKPRSRWTNDLETVVGDRSLSIRGYDFGRAAIRSPFDGNVVVNFETEEAIFDYVFDRFGFTSTLDSHSLILTECLLNPTYSRNTMLELLFEAYEIPQVVFVPDCLAAFWFNQSSGNCSGDGMMLASGHSATHVVPIIDGKALLFHAQRSKICGSQSTFHLQQLTLLHNPQCAGSLSRRTVELMKEQCSICSQNYIEDLEKIQNEESTAGGFGVRVQLPKTMTTPATETIENETPVDKSIKAEEQRNRLKAMSQKRKQKMIQEKQELLKYLQEIQIQLAETEDMDIKGSILTDAEVETVSELEKLINETEANIERLLTPSPPKPALTPASESKSVQENNIESIRARYKELTEQVESKKRSRMNASNPIDGSSGNKRVSIEQRRRMKLVAEAAAIDEDDDFGADDRDWDVYKEMDRHHSDSEIDKQTEAELQMTKNKLRDLGEDVDKYDVFGKELGKETQLDENQVYLSVERIRIPELIFQPCLMGINQAGIPEIISRALKTLPVELNPRCRTEILVYGGNTTFPGFSSRLAAELCSVSPLDSPMRVIPAVDPFLDAWKGAALLAGSSGVLEGGYTLREYQELGPEAFKRKKLPFVHYS